MATTPTDLDVALDRHHVIPVHVSAKAPLPATNKSYDPVRNILQPGFTITTRELLHAIGSKTASLPSSAKDDCLRASLLYTYILDLSQPHLCFKTGIDPDLQTPRSQEVGIGMMCLFAGKLFGIPWDQLGSLPGPGLRFDYRGRVNNFDGIFEAKGTSHSGNQSGQIDHGLEKKAAHHTRGDRFNVELIISTFIGRGNKQPKIVIGDPDYDRLSILYDKANNRFFRLRHYSRVLQFVGLPKSAFALNQYARAYLKGERKVGETILDEKQAAGYLDTETLGGNRYYGRWFEEIAPKDSRRYNEELYGKELLRRFDDGKKRKVFQGLREDVYLAGFEGEPFTQDLLSTNEIRAAMQNIGQPVSIFPDGTIQIFIQD